MECRDSAEDWEPEAAQDYDALLIAVFGESDSDEDLKNQQCREEKVDIELDDEFLWEKVEEVEGLWHCSNFLSIKQQESLLEAIESGGGALPSAVPSSFRVQPNSKPENRTRNSMMGRSVANLSWDVYTVSIAGPASFSLLLNDFKELPQDWKYVEAMRFGDLPGWATDLSALIRRSDRQSRVEGLEPQKADLFSEIAGPCEFRNSPFPSRILDREPLFDQMIVNMYQPGEGISAHVDLLRFEDGIAIVSLESACVMSFRPVNNLNNGVQNICRKELVLDAHQDSSPAHGSLADTKEAPHFRPLLCKQPETSRTIPQARHPESPSYTYGLDSSSGAAKRVDVLLNPGDLIIAYGPARYDWTHEINRGSVRLGGQRAPVSRDAKFAPCKQEFSFLVAKGSYGDLQRWHLLAPLSSIPDYEGFEFSRSPPKKI